MYSFWQCPQLLRNESGKNILSLFLLAARSTNFPWNNVENAFELLSFIS
jgi:hypothetical protein